MGIVRQVGLVILGISFFTFIALFGHVPKLRSTPIGRINRFMWSIFPRWLSSIDRRFTGGYIGPFVSRVGNYLMNEKHPVVMAFYLTLDFCPHCRYTARALRAYPYDHVNFRPGVICRTCHLRKPARSKHCSTCKHCIAKHDHHCVVWINNCVGQLNIRHFIFFLVATDILLTYGVYLAFDILRNVFMLRAVIPSNAPISSLPWSIYMHLLGIIIVEEIYIGAVFLLASLTGILSYAFTIYHLYLIWAGTTTNETIKWSDWQDDIRNGDILIAEPDENPPCAEDNEYDEDELCRRWPKRTTQLFYRRDPGNVTELPPGFLWRRIESLSEMDNVYDLGWSKNFEDVFWPQEL
ncbi:zf-DHHC-domain-containing protein [Tuber magnatum]|uniref:Palmitoyltransferase n=1 Tax=Tuber magnatum TaxID=42249 RepID=A0A317SUM2_9PEZI|nr:zf-DHHC-domain-containing protein [Tuber magnatum]